MQRLSLRCSLGSFAEAVTEVFRRCDSRLHLGHLISISAEMAKGKWKIVKGWENIIWCNVQGDQARSSVRAFLPKKKKKTTHTKKLGNNDSWITLPWRVDGCPFGQRLWNIHECMFMFNVRRGWKHSILHSVKVNSMVWQHKYGLWYVVTVFQRNRMVQNW